MNMAGWDIEWIVREVVRRLQAQASNSPAAATTNGTSGQDATRLSLDDRVITMRVLEGRLSGIRTVSVATKAVVTPSVKDELKQRGVQLVREHSPAKSGTTIPAGGAAKLLVASLASGCDAQNLLPTSGVKAEQLKTSGKSLENVIREFATTLSSGRWGVLLCETPAAAVVLANRNTSLRAAMGTNFPAIRRAIEEVNANLLVVDPQGRSQTELATMIGEFVRGRE